MEPKNENDKKYYRFLFYYDQTSKKIFVYDPNANRYTLNFANKWSYVIIAFIVILGVLGILTRSSR
jgi:uncharacterized membrane protein